VDVPCPNLAPDRGRMGVAKVMQAATALAPIGLVSSIYPHCEQGRWTGAVNPTYNPLSTQPFVSGYDINIFIV
jgi:hypothetical protein